MRDRRAIIALFVFVPTA